MKEKIFDKKLLLNKNTVSNLNHGSMKKVYGGCNETDCRSCPPTGQVGCSIDLCVRPTTSC